MKMMYKMGMRVTVPVKESSKILPADENNVEQGQTTYEMGIKRNLTISIPPPRENLGDLIPIEDNNSDEEPVVNTQGEDKLLQAAKEGDLRCLKNLILQGVNRECSDEFSNTPLLLAAGEGHYSIVQYLIAKHANLVAVNDDGWTALEMAVANGVSWDEYEESIESGIGDDAPAVVELLMWTLRNNNDAWDEYTENNVWGEAIGIAAQRGNDESLKALRKHLNLYKQRIKDEAKRVTFEQGYLNYSNEDGETPVMLAARSRHVKEGVSILIAAGACYERANNAGWDALCCAASGGTLQVFMFLMDTIKKDQDYFKHYCEKGRLGMVLLAASKWHDSCDYSLDDIESAKKIFYLLKACTESGQYAAQDLMLKYTDEYQNTALHLATACGKTFTAAWLLQIGVPWNTQNKYGQTALDFAREFTVPDSHPEKEALTIGKQNIIAWLEYLTMSMMPQAKTAQLLSMPVVGSSPQSPPALSTPAPEEVSSSSTVPEEQPKELLEQFKGSRKRSRNQRDQNRISKEDERSKKNLKQTVLWKK